MPKSTIAAPANIAFVKYWGAKDLERAIPCNPSVSMTLSRCVSTCTAEPLDGGAKADEVWLVQSGGAVSTPPHDFNERVCAQIDRIREWAGWDGRFRVATRTDFPSAAGLASSASGFAALTLACVAALDRMATAQELSTLARRSGSGSAARSCFGGYVEWPAGGPDDDPWAGSLASADDWDLRDVIAVVEIGPKAIPSLEGHRRAPTSPYYAKRLELLADRLERTRRAIRERDFELLGPTLEEEAVDLHLIAMSSRPPIFYWSSGTVEVLRLIREMRQEGVEAYATMDAGANVHVICTPEAEDDVADRLEELPSVGFVIRDGVGPGPTRELEHLF
ncbi:MAG TPA: diphosphomevalonate decarboxylase [Thermoanaerobaculia bacterium]|nr:diphosphomevalonate decarboxylase [Thermoanaerobaculia bacterium]